MTDRVELVWLGRGDPPHWSLGKVHRVDSSCVAIADCLAGELGKSKAEAWLFWDGRLGPPSPDRVEEVLGRPGDVWHAGLQLGMAGLPTTIDFVAPAWMLNRDPDPSIEATSWRLSRGLSGSNGGTPSARWSPPGVRNPCRSLA